jgi:hypothetical protein
MSAADHPPVRRKPRRDHLAFARAVDTAVAEWHNLRLTDLQFWHRSEARRVFWLLGFTRCCWSSAR